MEVEDGAIIEDILEAHAAAEQAGVLHAARSVILQKAAIYVNESLLKAVLWC